MKLIYASYPLMDKDQPPDWVEKFAAATVPRVESWAIYSPFLGFESNVDNNLPMMAAIAGKPARVTQEKAASLKLDPDLLLQFSEVLPRLRMADQLPTLDVTFKSLYVLLRSDIVLVDLNQQGHGEPSQEVLYAYLCGVPIVGIAHRFMLSPWMVDKMSAVIFPKTSDDIVRQVLAHDHKTTATLSYYRMAEAGREKQQSAVEGMQELKDKVDELRDAASEASDRAADKKAGVNGRKPPEQNEDGGQSGSSPV